MADIRKRCVMVALFLGVMGWGLAIVAAPISVIVSIPPQQEWVKAIGGDEVEVVTLLPPGASPATFTLSPKTLRTLSKAKLYIAMGQLPFEKATLEKIQLLNPTLKIITLQSVEKDMDEHNHGQNRHRNHHDDPHTWLNPMWVYEAVVTIEGVLSQADPEQASAYIERRKAYQEKLSGLDRHIIKSLSKRESKVLLIYHPFLGHFSKRYGLTQLAIEKEGKEPTGPHLKALIDRAKKEKVTTLITQHQLRSGVPGVIAESLNAKVVTMNPLASNYIDMLTTIVDRL